MSVIPKRVEGIGVADWTVAAVQHSAPAAASMIHTIARIVTIDLDRNFRFGPLSRALYAPPTLDTTNWPPEHAPARSRGSDGSFLARLKSAACCRGIDFSDTAPTLLLRPQILHQWQQQ